jgi:hypothetical protein
MRNSSRERGVLARVRPSSVSSTEMSRPLTPAGPICNDESDRFLRDRGLYNIDQVASFNDAAAQRCVERRIAAQVPTHWEPIPGEPEPALRISGKIKPR